MTRVADGSVAYRGWRVNPVDHLLVIPPPAPTPVTGWQERPQPFPVGITRIAPPHAHRND